MFWRRHALWKCPSLQDWCGLWEYTSVYTPARPPSVYTSTHPPALTPRVPLCCLVIFGHQLPLVASVLDCLGRRALPQAALCLNACIRVQAAGVSSAPAAPSLRPQTTQNSVVCFILILFPCYPPSPSCCHFEMKSSAHIFNKSKLTST